MAKHNLGALSMRAVVLGKQEGVGGHVVVEKQENFAGRFSCARFLARAAP